MERSRSLLRAAGRIFAGPLVADRLLLTVGRGRERGEREREREREGSRTDFGTEPIPGGTKARQRRSKDRSERIGRTDGGFAEARGLPRAVLLPVDSRQPTYLAPSNRRLQLAVTARSARPHSRLESRG